MYALSLQERAMEPVGKVLVHRFYNRVPRNRGPCGQSRTPGILLGAQDYLR